MNEKEKLETVARAPGLSSSKKRNPLGFSLEFRENSALVSLRNRSVAHALLLEDLEMEVPDVRFPFDVSGGAEQFRHRRCSLRLLKISLNESELFAVLKGAFEPERYGIDLSQVQLGERFGRLSGEYIVGSSKAPFSIRFVVEPTAGMSLRVDFFDVRIFGWLAVPGSTVVSQLGRALAGYGFEQSGPATLEIDPVYDLLKWLLPTHGWKIPDLRGLSLARAFVGNGKIQIITARYPGELPGMDQPVAKAGARAERDALVAREGMELYDRAEQAFMKGRLQEARSLYLGNEQVEAFHPLASKRLMEIALLDPEKSDELLDLADDRLRRADYDVSAILAKACMLEKLGKPGAGEVFAQAAAVCKERREPDDAVLAYFKAAGLLWKNSLDDAVVCLENLLSIQRDHIGAMRLLADAYEDLGRWYRALRIHLRLAGLVDEPEQVAERHARCGVIYLDRLDALDRARKHLDAALAIDGENILALSSQASVQQRLGRPERAAKLLVRCVEVLEKTGRDGITGFRLRLAKLWDEQLDDPAVALAHYTRILKDEPDHLDALFRAGRLAVELDQPEQAAESFGRLLELAEAGTALPDEILKAAGMSLGKLYMDRPGGLSEAMLYFNKVVQLDPREIDAWESLEDIYRQQQDWAGLVVVLEQKVVLLSDTRQVALTLIEAAELCLTKLNNSRRAEEFLSKALEWEPSSDTALDRLVTILNEQQRWDELEKVISGSIKQDLPTPLAARRWFELGRIRVEHLKDLEGGLHAMDLAVRLEPDNTKRVFELLSLYRQHSKYEQLVSLTPKLNPDAFEEVDWVELWLERALILAERLDRPAEALESYEKVVLVDPHQLAALRAMADLHYKSERWQEAKADIGKVLEYAGEGGLSSPGRTELHRRLAKIEMELGNIDRAIEEYQIVLSRFGEDEQAASMIATLLRETQKWDELAAFYARRAESASGEEAAALHTAAASIWGDKLEMLEQAAAQYKAAVDAAPDSAGVSARLSSLQRLYSDLSKWADVADVLRKRIELEQPGQVPNLYMGLASILKSRLKDEDGSIECWRQALEQDPDFSPALIALAEYHYSRGDYDEALEMGSRALENIESQKDSGVKDSESEWRLPSERKAEVALMVARAAWQLNQQQAAVRFYLMHMELFADHGYSEVDPEALERLEMLLRQQRRYDDLALLFRRWLKTDLIRDRQRGIKRALSLILYEHLEQPDEAIRILSEMVREDPDDQAAVGDLTDLLRRSSRWEHLARLLEGQWEMAPSEEERMDRLVELSELYQLKLFDSDAAIKCLKLLLERGYDNAFERLKNLYRQEGMNEELVSLLEKRASSSENPETAASLWSELGAILRDDLNRLEPALDAMEHAFEIVPTPENRDSLLELVRRLGPAERLEQWLERLASEDEDPEQRRQLLLEHADVCLEQLSDTRAGLASIRQALEIRPDESLARRALALYESELDFEGVADMQELLVDLCEDDKSRAQRLFALGRTFAEYLDAPERSRAAFEAASKLDPSWLEPHLALSKLLEDAGDMEELLEVKIRVAQVTKDKQERGQVLKDAALLAFEKLGDDNRGVDLLKKAASLVAEPASLWLDLASRLEGMGEPAEAADALEQLMSPDSDGMDAGEGGQTPASVFRRVAALRQMAGEELAAIAAYERTLRQEPSDEESARALQDLYRKHGRFDDLAQMLTDLANRRSGPDAAETWSAAAEAYREIGDDDGVDTALGKALEADPDNDKVIRSIQQRLLQQQHWSRLLGLLEGRDSEFFEDESSIRAVLGCYEGIVADPDSLDEESRACRLMLRIDPVNIDALARAAKIAGQDGRQDDEEKLLRRLDQQGDRLDADSRYELDLRLAKVDFSRGKTEDAETRLKRCILSRPDEKEPREFLHKLYDGVKRYGDRVSLLLDEAERCESTEDRFKKIHEAANLLETELGDPKGAAEIYEKLLEDEPDRLEAWRRLGEIYRLLDNPEDQARALRQVGRLAHGDEKLKAYRMVSRLSFDTMDNERSRDDLERLLELLPGDVEALDRLLNLDRKENNSEQLDLHLAQRIAVTTDTVALAGLLRERATVLIDDLGRAPDAIDVLNNLRALLPSDDDTLSRLHNLLRSTERFEQLQELLQRRIGLAGTELEQAGLWLELAQLRHLHLQNSSGAIVAYRHAAALDPSSTEPLELMRKLGLQTGDDSVLLEALELLAARTPQDEEQLQLRRTAGLLNWSLGKKDEARRAFAKVLSIDNEDVVGRRFMAKLLFEQDPRTALEHLRWLVQRPDVLPKREFVLLHRQLVKALQNAEPEEEIIALEQLMEIAPEKDFAELLADKYREVGRKHDLANLLEKIAEMEQGESGPGPWIERAEILLDEGRSKDAADALNHALRFDGPHRLEVAVRLGRIQQDKLNDSSAAIEAFEAAHEIEPGDQAILQDLADLYEIRQDWSKAVEALVALLSSCEADRRSDLSLRLADAMIADGQIADAVKVLEKVTKDDPGCTQAFERLEPLEQDAPGLQKGLFYLNWAGSVAAGARRPELYLLAAQHLSSSGDEESALRALMEASRLDPDDTRFYERMLALLEDKGRYEESVEILKRWISVEPQEHVLAGLELRAAQLLLNNLDDRASAVEHLEKCLSLEPGNKEAVLELADIRYEQENWSEANELYRRLDGEEPESEKLRIVLRRGELEGRVGNHAQAVGCYEQAVSLTPDNQAAWRGLVVSLDAMGRTQAAIDAVDELVAGSMADVAIDQTLVELEQALESGALRAHLLGKLGERDEKQGATPELWIERAELLVSQGLFDQAAESLRRALALPGEHAHEVAVSLASIELDELRDEDAGIKSLKLVTELDDADVHALGRLSDLLWRKERWEEAAKVTGRLLELADREHAPGMALRLGDIRVKQGDEKGAMELFDRALEIDGGYRQAYERMEQLLAGNSFPEQLAGFYLRWARSEAGPPNRSTLLRTSARQFEKAGMIDKAVEILSEALTSDPDNPVLSEAMAPLLAQQEKWEELLLLLEHHVKQAQDVDRLGAMLLEMGQICTDHIHDVGRAVGYFEQCLEIDPDSTAALEQLAQIKYQQKDFVAARELYERLGNGVSSSGKFIARFRLGEIYQGMGDDDKALELYRSSIDSNPSFLPSRQNLIGLLLKMRDWSEAAEAIDEMLDVLPDEGFDDVALELLVQLAFVKKSQLQFDSAAKLYEQIVQKDPGNLEVLDALYTLYFNQMKWSDAARTMEKLVSLDLHEEQRIKLLQVLGELYLDKLGRKDDAERVFKLLVSSAALLEKDALLRMWALFRTNNAMEQMCEIGPRLLDSRLDDYQRYRIGVDLARAWLASGRDAESALSYFERAMAWGKAELFVVDECAELARSLGRWDLYASLAGQSIEKRLETGLDQETAIEGYLELARVYQEQVGDIERAGACVRRALEFNPRDPELLRRLGHLYASNFDTYNEAIAVFRELLGMDPSDPGLLRYLARLEAAKGDADRTACYYYGLSYLMPSDEEPRRYLSYVGKPGKPTRPLSGDEWNKVFLHPQADCLLQRIVASLAPFIEQLFPANMDRFQLVGSEASSSEHAELFHTGRVITWMLGGRQVRLLLARENVYRAWLESGPVPTVVFSSSVLERSAPAELTFFVAREVTKVAMGGILPYKFSRADMTQLLAILSKLAGIQSSVLPDLPTTAPQYVEAIKRITPPDILNNVLPLIRQYALEPRAHDMSRWINGISQTANRIALLACGDLNAALSVLTRFSAASGGRELAFVPDRASLLTSDDDMLSLFRFAFSEPYFQTRKAVGVALETGHQGESEDD